METGIPEPLFAVPHVTAATDEDGALVIRSAEPLAGYPVTVMHSVRAWAAADPGHPMVAERTPGGWRTCGYGEAAAAADAIGQGLLDRGLGPGRPLLVLSGNSVDHLLVTLGAMTAGPGGAGQRGLLAAEPRPRQDPRDHRDDPAGRGLRRRRGAVRGGAGRGQPGARHRADRVPAGSRTAR